jgi:hypothetical protein
MKEKYFVQRWNTSSGAFCELVPKELCDKAVCDTVYHGHLDEYNLTSLSSEQPTTILSSYNIQRTVAWRIALCNVATVEDLSRYIIQSPLFYKMNRR